MRLPLRVAHEIRARGLIAPGARVLVALSGGPDSVALLRCMLELAAKRDLRFQLSAAHLNHGIRGKHADRDEAFCVKLCRKFDAPLVCAHADTPELARSIRRSVEESARIVRHEFLARAAEALHADAVAVAHHADDRIETVLFRICRGTGVSGLQGIGWKGPLRLEREPDVSAWIEWGNAPRPHPRPLPVDGEGRTNVVRPMLACSRREVLDYLRSKRQRYCTDETNFDVGIPRNAIRGIVLPALEKNVHAGARAALWRLAEEAESVAAERQWRRDWLAAFADCAGGALTLPAPDGREAPSIAELSDVLDILRRTWALESAQFTLRHAQALQQLFAPHSGPKMLNFPAGVVAQRRGKSVVLARQ